MSARGPVSANDEASLRAACRSLLATKTGAVVPLNWDPFCWSGDAIELTFVRHMQITVCERAVRADQVVEHYADHKGDKQAALRYAIVRAALA